MPATWSDTSMFTLFFGYWGCLFLDTPWLTACKELSEALILPLCEAVGMAPNAQTPKQRSMRERQGFPELTPSLLRRSLFCSQTDRGLTEVSSSRIPEVLGLWGWLWDMQKLISSALSTALDRLFRTSRLGPTEHLLKGSHPQVSSHGRVGWIVPGGPGENGVLCDWGMQGFQQSVLPFLHSCFDSSSWVI